MINKKFLSLFGTAAIAASSLVMAASPAQAVNVPIRPAVATVIGVTPIAARTREMVEITVTDIDLSSMPTVEFIHGATTLGAEVLSYSGNASGGDITVLVPDFDWSTIDTSGFTFPMSYVDYTNDLIGSGEIQFDIKVTQGLTNDTLENGFIFAPPVMLGNDFLRAGGCGGEEDDTGIVPMDSIMPWGALAQQVTQINTLANDWHLILPPCVALSVTLLALNFLGDGLRDALDPQSGG